MKYIALAFLLAAATACPAYATSYYISPSGNDSNTGTISSPFFTLNKAWSVCRAGDVIYARGGTYRFDTRQNLTGKNGTASDTIRIWAYPGERPVFTKSSSFQTPSWPVCLIYVKANYIHIRGIEVSHFKQKTSTIWYGIAVLGSAHNKFEQIHSHHNGHGMVIRDESNHNLVLNCDFHHNFDPISPSPYGDGDGLEVAYLSSSMENTVKGCRMWRNADDGLDLWQNNGNLILEDCWSWHNGYREDGRTQGGDGGGFKFGSTTTQNGSSFKRTVRNNVAVFNRTRGYNQNAANVKFYFYNNIAYRNPKGFDFPSYNLPHVFRNNIVFSNDNNYSGSYSNALKDHNSLDPVMSPSGPAASAADFISLDTTGISGPRRSDGRKPDISFLKLAQGSDLIDAGVSVGLAYSGKAPDLGAFESGSGSPATATLDFVGAEVKNGDPAKIEVHYNLGLSTAVPSTSCFEVKVNSASRSITTVTAAGKDVYLSLSSPVMKGDVVTLTYTRPATNPLSCTGGTLAPSISAKSVMNSVTTSMPELVEAAVNEQAPDKVEMSFDAMMAKILPSTGSFTTTVNGEKQAIVAVAVSENRVILTLPVPVDRNDTITVAYNPPSVNPLQTVEGAKIGNLPAHGVTNNITSIQTDSETVINDGKILIFPNPAKEFVRIANLIPGDISPVLRLFDFSGKLCAEIKLENLDKNRKIPIDLKPGMFVAQILIGSTVTYVQKLIVVR